MKVLHIADLHVGHRCYGIRQRQEAFRKTFTGLHDNGLIDVVRKIQPGMVIIAGDITDSSHVLYDDLGCLVSMVRLIKDATDGKCRIVGVSGNHDRQDDSCTQIADFLGIKSTNGIKDIKVVALDHIKRCDIDDRIKEVEECDILVMHQSAGGFLPTIMRPELTDQNILDLCSKCSYLALGDLHVHSYMSVGDTKVAYPGTLDFLRVGESHNKFGGWLWDTDSRSIESVSIVPHQKTIIHKPIDCAEGSERLRSAIQEVDEPIFLVVPCSLETGHPARAVLLEALRSAASDNTEFCFRMIPVKGKGKKSERELDISSSASGDFFSIINSDRSIDEDDKTLASDLWGAPSTKTIPGILERELEREKNSDN